MFGYVRPLKPLLQTQDEARYQAAYCGLCCVIGARYGFVAQMFLNYDFAFLAMLLSQQREHPCVECHRCPVHPFRKRETWKNDPGLELAAAESVILCYWKLKDSIQDSGFWKKILAYCLTFLLRPGYRKAAREQAAFDETVRQCLGELRKMEEAGLPSIDRPADAFARILQAAPATPNLPAQAALSQMLYHVGRWIYLVDAWDDLEEDRKSGSYNPILLSGSCDTEEGRQAFQDSLAASIGLAQTAYEWLDNGVWSPVLENIVTLGLPAMQEAVLTGEWKARKKRILRRSGDE